MFTVIIHYVMNCQNTLRVQFKVVSSPDARSFPARGNERASGDETRFKVRG